MPTPPPSDATAPRASRTPIRLNGGAHFIIAVIAVVGTSLFWNAAPDLDRAYFGGALFGSGAAPRPVAARGELSALERSNIEIFEAARGSVVFISTRETRVDPWTRNAATARRGSGSGFIWDDAGHVVTNYHVVEGASEASVRLADGRAFRAALVGASPEHDLAVLRIGVAFQRPPPIPLGRSRDLRVGQSVLAIGNPFGLDWTLTTGVVSALDRALPVERGPAIQGVIQTDAAINPGNSGGPLLDSAGRLIGVNTAIFSPSGANSGIGFAVPVDTVNRVAPALIADGRYLRPALGVEVDARMNAVAARDNGIDGVFVLGVAPGSGAARAGLRPARMTPDGRFAPGDVIIALDGGALPDVPALSAALEGRRIGEEVSLTVLRNGRERRINLTLGPAS